MYYSRDKFRTQLLLYLFMYHIIMIICEQYGKCCICLYNVRFCALKQKKPWAIKTIFWPLINARIIRNQHFYLPWLIVTFATRYINIFRRTIFFTNLQRNKLTKVNENTNREKCPKIKRQRNQLRSTICWNSVHWIQDFKIQILLGIVIFTT